MGRIDDRLKELGILLPQTRAPLANYVPAYQQGNLVFTAGQVSASAEREHKGKAGGDVSLDEAREAARVCALNAVAALLTVIDSLDRVKRIVRVGGFVNSAPGFTQQPAVLNGASDLLVEIFGEAGKHVRTAVGVAELPAGYTVEIDMIAEIE